MLHLILRGVLMSFVRCAASDGPEVMIADKGVPTVRLLISVMSMMPVSFSGLLGILLWDVNF